MLSRPLGVFVAAVLKRQLRYHPERHHVLHSHVVLHLKSSDWEFVLYNLCKPEETSRTPGSLRPSLGESSL